MIEDRPSDVLEVLNDRRPFVTAVSEGPRRKPALAEEFDVSRSTVNRAIRDLETARIVTRVPEGYVTTTFGDLALEHYELLLSDLEVIDRAAPILTALPPEAPMALEFLEDASVHKAESPATHRPIDEFHRRLSSTDRLRSVSKAITQSDTPRIIEQRVRNGMECDVVATSDLVEYARTELPERTYDLINSGRYCLYELEGLPYGLVIGDQPDGSYAIMFAYRDGGDLAGTIVNDTVAAVDWASSIFDHHCEAATEVEPDYLLADD